MTWPEDFRRLPVTQIVGGHKRWQALDERTLLALGEESGKVVEVVSSVGDTLVEGESPAAGLGRATTGRGKGLEEGVWDGRRAHV